MNKDRKPSIITLMGKERQAITHKKYKPKSDPKDIIWDIAFAVNCKTFTGIPEEYKFATYAY
jgi:hypothetical protein